MPISFGPNPEVNRFSAEEHINNLINSAERQAYTAYYENKHAVGAIFNAAFERISEIQEAMAKEEVVHKGNTNVLHSLFDISRKEIEEVIGDAQQKISTLVTEANQKIRSEAGVAQTEVNNLANQAGFDPQSCRIQYETFKPFDVQQELVFAFARKRKRLFPGQEFKGREAERIRKQELNALEAEGANKKIAAELDEIGRGYGFGYSDEPQISNPGEQEHNQSA